jgi:hypothetical protein
MAMSEQETKWILEDSAKKDGKLKENEENGTELF